MAAQKEKKIVNRKFFLPHLISSLQTILKTVRKSKNREL